MSPMNSIGIYASVCDGTGFKTADYMRDKTRVGHKDGCKFP